MKIEYLLSVDYFDLEAQQHTISSLKFDSDFFTSSSSLLITLTLSFFSMNSSIFITPNSLILLLLTGFSPGYGMGLPPSFHA